MLILTCMSPACQAKQICARIAHLWSCLARLAPIIHRQHFHCECDERLLLLSRAAKSRANSQLGRALSRRAQPCFHVYRSRTYQGRSGDQCHGNVDGGQRVCGRLSANILDPLSQSHTADRLKDYHSVPAMYEACNYHSKTSHQCHTDMSRV
jgi:hypothetical protein